jgi:hypothetical protein
MIPRKASFRRSGLFRKWASFCALALVGLAAHPFTGCEGGSTGVDNPGLSSLTVDFEDMGGRQISVQGHLDVYARTHNPAVDSQPLLRVQIESASGVDLLAEDFARIGTASSRVVDGLTKRAVVSWSARVADYVESDGLLHFNLLFQSPAKTGATRAGFTFDPVKKVFGREDGARLPAVALNPASLVRFASQFDPSQVSESLGRVILPGTPYQGTLVDSQFALEDVPPGQFNAQFVGGDGKVFALKETLNTTSAPTAFTAHPQPIGQITVDLAQPGFQVSLNPTQSATVNEAFPLEGKLLNANPDDPRIAFVWRVLPELSTGPAQIQSPAKWMTSIVFPQVGNYQVELSVTLGLTTVRDTMDFKVNTPFAIVEAGKILTPMIEEKIPQGIVNKVTWESKAEGLMRLEWIQKDGVTLDWHLMADSLQVVPGMGGPVYWTTPTLEGASVPCLIRLKRVASDSVIAQTAGVFYLTK